MLSAMCSGASFDETAWQRAACWEELNSFERVALLRALLDGDLTAQEANHAAWRGMGFTLDSVGDLRGPDGAPCTPASLPPDVLLDAAEQARMRECLESLDEEELEMLDTVVEALHGEELTRTLVASGDPEFLARRTLVQWLYTTQPMLKMR